VNANQFIKALEQLSTWREYTFILALAERAFPNYALFADAVGIKTGAKMRLLLNEAWGFLQVSNPEAQVTQALARLESLSPDTGEYDVYGVYPAFDFCQLVEQALLNRLNTSRERALEASQWATHTVAQFIEVTEGAEFDDDELVRLLDRHELMKADKQFQRDLLLELKRQRVPKESFIESIQAMAANEGVSNLGITLDDVTG
jgi:hypothetical protein